MQFSDMKQPLRVYKYPGAYNKRKLSLMVPTGCITLDGFIFYSLMDIY